MVGTVTPIYCGEESLPSRGIRARYRGRPARARGGQNNGNLAQPAEYFYAEARATGTVPGTHWAVCCCATAFRSPCRHSYLEQGRGGNRNAALCSTYCVDRQEPDCGCSVVSSNIVSRDSSRFETIRKYLLKRCSAHLDR